MCSAMLPAMARARFAVVAQVEHGQRVAQAGEAQADAPLVGRLGAALRAAATAWPPARCPGTRIATRTTSAKAGKSNAPPR